MGSPGGKSQGGNITQRGLHPPFPVQTQLYQVTNCHKQLCEPSQKPPPFGGTVSAGELKCSRTSSNSKITGVLQQAIFGSQTQQLVETFLGPEHIKYLPKHRVIQNGATRDNKNLPTGRGVGYLNRFQGCILPHTNSESVQEVHAFHIQGWSYQFKALSTTSMMFTVVAKEVKLMALQRGIRIHQYLDDWLVRATFHRTCVQHTQSLVALCRELGWLVVVRTGSKRGFQLCRLPVHPERVQGQIHTRVLAGLNRQDSVNTVQSGVSGLTVHVPHRSTHSNRKASPPRVTSYETHTVALE